MRTTPWPEDERMYPQLPFLSEKEHLEAEKVGYIESRMKAGDWKKTFSSTAEGKKESKFVKDAIEVLGTIPTAKPCANEACRLMWPLGKRICDGPTGCRTEQLTQREYISKLLGLAEDAEGTGEVNIEFENPRREVAFTRREKLNKFFASAEEVSEVEAEEDDANELLNRIRVFDDGREFHAQSIEELEDVLQQTMNENALLGEKRLKYEVVLTMFDNPNNEKAIKRVLTKYVVFLIYFFQPLSPFTFTFFYIVGLASFCG